MCRGSWRVCGRGHVGGPRGRPARHRLLQRGHARRRALRAAVAGGPVPGLLRHRRAGAQRGPRTVHARWPRFATVALDAGFRTAHALPMRLRGSVVGALNLFSTDAGALAEEDIVAGQALAAVATIAILQQRVVSEARIVNDQLNHALSSRVVIEQAKGVLAERTGLSMQAAFEVHAPVCPEQQCPPRRCRRPRGRQEPGPRSVINLSSLTPERFPVVYRGVARVSRSPTASSVAAQDPGGALQGRRQVGWFGLRDSWRRRLRLPSARPDSPDRRWAEDRGASAVVIHASRVGRSSPTGPPPAA